MNPERKRDMLRGLALAMCIVLSVVALLLWGRLKLVAGVPRSALADPEKSAQASPPAARNSAQESQHR